MLSLFVVSIQFRSVVVDPVSGDRGVPCMFV